MGIEVITGDVLLSSTDALLMTVDGIKRGLEGNVARQFARQYPDDWQILQRELRYPIPLGRSVAIPWDGDCPWKLLVFSSTLHHLEILDVTQKQQVLRSALTEALRLSARFGATSLASVVLQGGWRLDPALALDEMVATYQRAGCAQIALKIHRIAQDR